MAKSNSQLIIYQTQDGRTKIDVRFDEETVWLSQGMMAKLFGSTVANINIHIKNIFKEGELEESLVIKESLITAADNKKYKTILYNLDLIISVGYRIKSKTATRFRQWATALIKEYMIKGFVLDDERLKNPDLPFDYFDELLARIQDIRTSEKRFYQKITDIYATSVDYDPSTKQSIDFFKTVQNKMHWAITHQTAAEIIVSRASSELPNMGLTNWRGTKVRKTDVGIAKNYLSDKELKELNNLVEQYLIFAEGQALKRIPMTMQDWIKKLHGFLTLNDKTILNDAGKISHVQALQKAEEEYENYSQKRKKIESNKSFHELENVVKSLKL